MYKLKVESLEHGDIILIKSDSDVSQRVRQLSGSDFSHAMLYVGLSSYIDSDGLGVQANNVQRKLFSSNEDVKVLRLKDDILKQKLVAITNFARQKIGTEYSFREAFTALQDTSGVSAKESNRQFCTRFVSQAYNSAGINLTENPDYCLPDDLLKSNLLVDVLNVTREASEAEVEFANSESPLKNQIEIHNHIFNSIREISGEDIQTFEQLEKLIISHPEFDEEITTLIKESGYLNMMDKDFEKNPQHYFFNLFEKFYAENPLTAAKTILTIDISLQDASKQMINHFTDLIKKYPRQYFQMQLDLNKKLFEYSSTRLSVASEIWKKYSKESFESDFDPKLF